jgi:UDP-2,3-diacylglucosamine pyrophosphatase LpxH
LAAKIKLSVEDLVNPGFEQRFKDSVISYAKKGGFDGVIVGHTHIPAFEKIDDISYYNCGDFIDAMTLLVEHESGEFELLSFDEYIKE